MEIGEGLLRRKPGGMGDEEWRLCIELAACYRIFDYFGWTELIYNHITPTAGMAVATKRAGLRHDNFYGALLIGRLAYHDFEGISVHADEQPRLVASLEDKDVLILRNHGLLVVERDVPAALRLMWHLQRAGITPESLA